MRQEVLVAQLVQQALFRDLKVLKASRVLRGQQELLRDRKDLKEKLGLLGKEESRDQEGLREPRAGLRGQLDPPAL